MRFSRREDGQGILTDKKGNSVEISDDDIDAMEEMDGAERWDYIVQEIREPLEADEIHNAGKKKKDRGSKKGKTALEIMTEWGEDAGIVKKLNKVSFNEDDEDDDDEDDDDDDDEEEDEEEEEEEE